MKTVNKKFKVLGLMFVMIMMLTACSKSMSYTFNISTGDNIIVKLNTSDNYVLKQEDGVFTVSDESQKDILQGFFVTKEMYDEYLNVVAETGATILNTGDKNGCTYVQYQLTADTHTENNLICWIDGSNTGVVMASVESQEEVEKAFDLLSFSY